MLLYFEAQIWMFITTVDTTLKSKSEKCLSPKTNVVSNIKIFSNNNLIYVDVDK